MHDMTMFIIAPVNGQVLYILYQPVDNETLHPSMGWPCGPMASCALTLALLQCERTSREHQRSKRRQLAVNMLHEIYAGHTQN